MSRYATKTGYNNLTVVLAASGTATEDNATNLSGADEHHVSVVGSGTAQVDFHVNGQATSSQQVSVSAGSPVIVTLPGVTKIVFNETSTTNGATVTVNGR